MNISKYCKYKGMTLTEYKTFKENIKNIAAAIRENTPYTHGMYYPVNDILTFSGDMAIKIFIIQELKSRV